MFQSNVSSIKAYIWMLYDHAHAMQVKLCMANTRGVTQANFFYQRQAPKHFKPPMFYKISLKSFMFDALGYKSWLETLDA